MFLLVHDVQIAFIYFNHKENHSAVDLVGSLLKQLLQQGTELSPALHDLYAKHVKRNTRPSLTEISDYLVSESRAVTKVYVVLDALDECPVDQDIKDKVLSLLQKLPSLHLLVTSRPSTNISTHFNAVQLDIRADDHDMEMFVRDRLQENRNLKRYVRQDFKEPLIHEVVRKSDGM